MLSILKKNSGFTLIELMIAVAIIGILTTIVFGGAFRQKTENQAETAMQQFISKANINDISRATCAGDSDGDGYASCTIVTQTGEHIYLQCPCGLSTVFGASSCKEVPTVFGGYRTE